MPIHFAPPADLDWALPTLLNLALAMCLGGWLSQQWLDADCSGWAAAARHATAVMMGWSLWLGAVLLGGLLWNQAAVMGDVTLSEAAAFVWPTLRGSHFGAAWSVSLLSGLLLTASRRNSAQPGAARIGFGAALLLFAASRAAVSHAVEQGVWSWAVAIETVHVLCAGAWVGIVIVASMCFTFGRAHQTVADRAAAQQYLVALSHTATIALAGVMGSGAYNLWRTLAGMPSRLDQPWVWWLTVKLGLVAAAVVLGAINRWYVMPRLRTPSATTHVQTQLLRVLRCETVLLMLAMGAATILGTTPPPALS